MDDTNASNVFEWWGKAAESSIPFWKSWDAISESQKSILENYRAPLMDEYQKFVQLAPNTLSQTINPWSFSLFQITQQMKMQQPGGRIQDCQGRGRIWQPVGNHHGFPWCSGENVPIRAGKDHRPTGTASHRKVPAPGHADQRRQESRSTGRGLTANRAKYAIPSSRGYSGHWGFDVAIGQRQETVRRVVAGGWLVASAAKLGRDPSSQRDCYGEASTFPHALMVTRLQRHLSQFQDLPFQAGVNHHSPFSLFFRLRSAIVCQFQETVRPMSLQFLISFARQAADTSRRRARGLCCLLAAGIALYRLTGPGAAAVSPHSRPDWLRHLPGKHQLHLRVLPATQLQHERRRRTDSLHLQSRRRPNLRQLSDRLRDLQLHLHRPHQYPQQHDVGLGAEGHVCHQPRRADADPI